MTEMTRTNHSLTSSVLPTFYRLWIPSMLGLLALSTANIVDGLFIGNFVGAHALAAVNLIIPFFGILFGVTFMLAMGGSVRAGKYIGEKDYVAACNIFSKTLIAVIGLAALVTMLGLVFETALLRALGFTEQLVTVFLHEDESSVIALAIELVSWVWPVFLVNGLTMIVTSYLTALHLPVPSAIIALSRGLILPAVLLMVMFNAFPTLPFIVAIPLAEWLTFGLALLFLWRFFPNPQVFKRISVPPVSAP